MNIGPLVKAPFVLSCYSAAPVNVRAFGEIGASQKPLTPITLRLKRWSGCRCCLQHEQVGAFGGEGCGGEEGGGGCGDCGGRANSGAGGGGPWSVIASSVLVLPAEDLRSRQLHISTAELAGCCRARLDAAPAAFLQPAGTEPPVACRFGHSSLRDLRRPQRGTV